MKPRNVGQLLLALILPLIGALATAAPVTVTVNAWTSSVSGYAGDASGGFAWDSPSGFNTRSDVNYHDDQVNAGGTAEWAANFSMDTSVTYDQEFTHVQSVHTSDVFAEVDAGMTDGKARAQSGLSSYWVEFLVTEPVVYTGTQALYVGYETNYYAGRAFVTTGMILQPGYYSNRIAGQRVSVAAGPGQSASDSVTQTFDFNFARVPVPLPGTILLVASCLGFGVMGRRARKA